MLLVDEVVFSIAEAYGIEKQEGTISQEDYDFLAYENKMFAEFLFSMGLSQDEINEVAVTGKLESFKEEPKECMCAFCTHFFDVKED